jgi:hypothetical protein
METVPDALVIAKLSDYIKRNSPYGFYRATGEQEAICPEKILALFKTMGEELESSVVFTDRLERAWPSVSACLQGIHL